MPNNTGPNSWKSPPAISSPNTMPLFDAQSDANRFTLRGIALLFNTLDLERLGAVVEEQRITAQQSTLDPHFIIGRLAAEPRLAGIALKLTPHLTVVEKYDEFAEWVFRIFGDGRSDAVDLLRRFGFGRFLPGQALAAELLRRRLRRLVWLTECRLRRRSDDGRGGRDRGRNMGDRRRHAAREIVITGKPRLRIAHRKASAEPRGYVAGLGHRERRRDQRPQHAEHHHAHHHRPFIRAIPRGC